MSSPCQPIQKTNGDQRRLHSGDTTVGSALVDSKRLQGSRLVSVTTFAFFEESVMQWVSSKLYFKNKESIFQKWDTCQTVKQRLG